MAIISDNTKGNRLHDEKTGEFLEKNAAGNAKSKNAKGKKTGKGKFVKKPKPVVKTISETSAFDFAAAIRDLNQPISVGPLNSVEEVSDNIDKLFSKQVINHIDKLYGLTEGERWTEPWQFHPKANPKVNLNLFTCVLGKYRFPDNHAKMMNEVDFNRLAQDTEKYTRVYRGISSTGDKRAAIIKSYITADINNLDIYGNGCYGTNIYTTLDESYAYSYADYDRTKIIYGLVDKDARVVRSSSLSQNMSKIRDTWDGSIGKSRKSPLMETMKQKLVNHLQSNGIETSRAQEIGDGFEEALKSDISLMAILLGYDYQISDNGRQRNILNLKKWIIKG